MKRPIYTIEEIMLDDSFVDYCLNTNPKHISHWQTIINDSPEQGVVFDEAKKLVLSLHGGLTSSEVNRQIDKVRQELQDRKLQAKNKTAFEESSLSAANLVTAKKQTKRRTFRLVATYLAAASLILFVAVRFFQLGIGAPEEQLSKTEMLSYHSVAGHRQTITLPDGSTVILNSNSSIVLNKDFNKCKRDVFLIGNAFFKVAKNPQKPFTVTTEKIATTALGTEFYVRGRQTDSKDIEIDLLEGKVKVADTRKNDKKTTVFLLPGEKGVSRKGMNLQKGKFDSLQLRSWINGRIAFDKTPMSNVLEQLEEWYQVKIIVKNPEIKKHFISGEYQDASLQDVLKIVCFSIDCQYSFAGDSVIIE